MKLSRRFLRNVVAAVVGSLLIILMLHWFEHNQVYHPSRQAFATGTELGRPFEDVIFDSGNLSLHGWFFPANANSPRAHLAILVCHGNAGNITHRLDTAEVLLETGANVFLFDYRGYGRSQGNPSEEGTYQDAYAAHRWLRSRGFDPNNIIVFGESLGGGIGSELLLRAPAAGLILQSTFTSIPDIGAELFPWLPVKWLARIHYNTHAKLPKISVPVLVMHSPHDGLIPFKHGQKNFAAANNPKLFREIGGGHNDPLSDRTKFSTAIEDFLKLLEAPR